MTIEQRIEALERRCNRLGKTLVGVGTLALFAVVAGTAGWTVAYTGAISPSSITRKRFTYRIKPERFGFVSMGQMVVSDCHAQTERTGLCSNQGAISDHPPKPERLGLCLMGTKATSKHSIEPESNGFGSLGGKVTSRHTTQPEIGGFVSMGQTERSISVLQIKQRFLIPNCWETTSISRRAVGIPLSGSYMGEVVGGRSPFCPPVHRAACIINDRRRQGDPPLRPRENMGPVVTNL